MSYILEALKKSEKKRQGDDSVSAFHKTHPLPPVLKREKSRRDLQLWISVVLVLSCIGFISYNFFKKDQPNSVTERSELKMQSLPLETQPETTAVTPVPELRPNKEKVIVTTSASSPNEIIEPRPITTIEPITQIKPAEDKTPYLEELSPSFQGAVPKFKLAGHVFSLQPQLRMIMINNKIVREGEIIEKDFILHKITQDGVIVSKGTEHFRLKAY